MMALRSRKAMFVTIVVFGLILAGVNVAHGAGSGPGGAWGARYRAGSQASQRCQ
jgi:hypothetical protein